MRSMSITSLLALLVILLIVTGLIFSYFHLGEENELLSISSFEECAAAGYPIMESYPEQCRTPDGRLFVNEEQRQNADVLYAAPPQPTDCVIGGCSAQLCGERKDVDELVSTCEFRAEYACYKRFSACERQANGQCGWTPTEKLSQCLANPPAITPEM